MISALVLTILYSNTQNPHSQFLMIFLGSVFCIISISRLISFLSSSSEGKCEYQDNDGVNESTLHADEDVNEARCHLM